MDIKKENQPLRTKSLSKFIPQSANSWSLHGRHLVKSCTLNHRRRNIVHSNTPRKYMDHKPYGTRFNVLLINSCYNGCLTNVYWTVYHALLNVEIGHWTCCTLLDENRDRLYSVEQVATCWTASNAFSTYSTSCNIVQHLLSSKCWTMLNSLLLLYCKMLNYCYLMQSCSCIRANACKYILEFRN